MLRSICLFFAAAFLSCVRFGFDPDPVGPAPDLARPGDALVGDGPRDAQDLGTQDRGTPDTFIKDQALPDQPSTVDPTAPFGAPTPISALNSSAAESDPALSADQLRLYFERSSNLWVSTRSGVSATWGKPVAISELNTGSIEGSPCEAIDGKTIWFHSNRPDATAKGLYDLYVSTRAAVGTIWSTPAPIASLNTSSYEASVFIVASGLQVILGSDRAGGKGDFDLFLATHTTTSAVWSAAKPTAELNSSSRDLGAWLSSDLKVVYFYSTRGGGKGKRDIYVATRSAASAPFTTPVAVGGVNTASEDKDPWLTSDLRTIYFASDRNGNDDLFMATR